MKLEEPLLVVGLNVHKGINPIVDFGQLRKLVLYAISSTYLVQLLLDLRVAQIRILRWHITRVKNADALTGFPIELIGPNFYHAQNFIKMAKLVAQSLKKRLANRTRFSRQEPFIFLVIGKF